MDLSKIEAKETRNHVLVVPSDFSYCTVAHFLTKKDAKAIGRACRAYEGLVEALKDIKKLNPSISGPDRDKLIIRGMRSIAELALNKVGGAG